MPEFTTTSWESFKTQFFSVIRFVLYCFDMLFDTCRSNPMLYAFFFFPIFAVAFFLVFELVTNIAPFSGVINNHQVRGVLSASKLSAKSYGKSMSSSGSVQNLAAKKAAADAKSHAALISKVNGSGSSGTGFSSQAMSASGSSSGSVGGDIKSSASGSSSGSVGGDIKSSAEGKAIRGSNKPYKLAAYIKKRRDDAIARKEQDEAIYEQIEAEQNKYRLQHEEDEMRAEAEAQRQQDEVDRKFNMETHLYFSEDDDGNPVTITEKVNTRTGETVYASDTIRHTKK